MMTMAEVSDDGSFFHGTIADLRVGVSGSQILAHFMATYSKDVDAVVGFSPFKESSSFGFNGLSDRKPRRWNVTFCGSLRSIP
jgi:hypothetical protein